MPRVQTEYEPGAEALRTTAAPNIQTVQARYDPNSSTAFQLAEALGKAQPVLDNWSQDIERKKLQEQLLKQDTYKQAFSNSADGVSATQVGEKFPETNPIVRARVAEGAGGEYGRQIIQSVIQEVSQNDSIRLDSEKRKAFLEQKKAELIGKLGGDDFYKSGAIAAINRELGQYENQWTAQTAQYHQQVQVNDFSTKVGDALRSGNPAAALEQLDDQWKVSSSLNNLERNKAVVNTAIDVAFTANNGVGDPALLDKIPTRFLNEDAKNKIREAKRQIMERSITDFRNQTFLETQAREEAVRKGKIQIIGEIASGKPIDPAKYRDNPDLFSFAIQAKDAPLIPEAVSVAEAQRIKTSILDGSTMQGMDSNKIIDMITGNSKINSREKQDLIKEVPKLLEGRIAMDDPMVKNAMQFRLDSALKALESGPNADIYRIQTGGNLRGEAVQMFEKDLQSQFMAYYQDHGSFPTGKAKLDLVESSVLKAEKYIADRTKIGGKPAATPAAPSASAPAAPAPAPGKVRRYNPATGKIE